MIKVCKECGNTFTIIKARMETARYCSYKCRNLSYKERLKGAGNPFWGKTHKPENTSKGKKFPERSGVNHFAWKGENVGYGGLHDWVRKILGTPNNCMDCGSINLRPRQYHWANKSGKYHRDISDWIRLCVRCHKKLDINRVD